MMKFAWKVPLNEATTESMVCSGPAPIQKSVAWLTKNSAEREVKPQVDIHSFKDDREINVLAKGRLVNLATAEGPSMGTY